MGLLAGQTKTINDGNDLIILEKLFERRYRACVNFITNCSERSKDTFLWPLSYGSIETQIESALDFNKLETEKSAIRWLINDYKLTIDEINQLYGKYIVECIKPYNINVVDDISFTIDYKHTIDFLSDRDNFESVILDVLKDVDRIEHFGFIVNAYISYSVKFTDEFHELQEDYLKKRLKEKYNVDNIKF